MYRFNGYWRKRIGEDGEAIFSKFDENHFREAGVGYSPVSGMPLLESYELMNKWNRATATFGANRSVYWLEAQ